MGKMKYNPFTDSLDFVNKPSDTAYGASWDGVTDVAPSKNAIYDKIQSLAGGHDAVTLDVNADTLLSLTGQAIGLDAQTANRIWAGPISGVAAVPTFRALVADDIPDLSGTYLTAETDPDFNAWLLATPPLYPGGWYDAVQNTIGLSGFNNDAGFITSFDDEKVKYDAGDPTAGYVADKIIAGTGISVAEGTGANENKLVVTSDITQYTDSDAISAIQGDASWNASDWDTAYGWGNHAGLYLPAATVLPANEAGSANNFLTAYNSTTGAFSKAQPTWADIDKTTSDIADITTKSHTSLTDIGTNTHAQIDTHLAGKLSVHAATTSAELAGVISDETGSGKLVFGTSPTLITPTLGVASATSINIGSPETPTTGRIYASSTVGVFTDGGSAHNTLRSFGNTAANGGIFTFYRYRGSYASPTVVQSGDILGRVSSYTYDSGGSVNRLTADMRFESDGAPTASTAPTKIVFATTGTDRLTISSAGAITSTGATQLPSLGLGMAPSGNTGVVFDAIVATGVTASNVNTRLTDETVNNFGGFRTLVGTSTASNSNVLGNTRWTITQADPSTLKSKFEVTVNTGDSVKTGLTITDDLEATFAKGVSMGGTGLTVTKLAEASTAETLATFKISDDATSYLKFINQSTSNSAYIPAFESLSNSTSFPSFVWYAIASADSGTQPCMAFDGRISGGAISTRPIVEFRNYATKKVTIAADGAITSTGTITGTSFIIGANTLDTNEWAFLDGQDQAVLTTSTPSFNGATLTGNLSISESTTGITQTITNTNDSASGARGAGLALVENDGAALASGDRLGYLLFGGSSSSTDVRYTGGVVAYANQNWVNASAYGTKISIESTADNATSRTETLYCQGTQTYAIGNVSALSFTDRTPYFEGDALSAIKGVKGKSVKGKMEIDHSSLPEFARKTIKVKKNIYEKDKIVGVEEYEEEGRDLGAMISILTKAVQELTAKVENLEKGV